MVGGGVGRGRARWAAGGDLAGLLHSGPPKLGSLAVSGFGEWAPGPPGVGTSLFQRCRQERGQCLNLSSRVQTPCLLEPVIKLAVPRGAGLYSQTRPSPPAPSSTLTPQMQADGQAQALYGPPPGAWQALMRSSALPSGWRVKYREMHQ